MCIYIFRIIDITISPNTNNFITAACSNSYNKSSLLLWSMKTFQIEVIFFIIILIK